MSRVDYDAELQKHNEVLRRAYGIAPNDHVLDIGCGAGQTTRDAARFATAGSVVGVDTSASIIERARQLTETAGLHNVSFLQADAETHHFPSESFDIAISRFGTMFFADSVAAFASIARALRPMGRLVMMVWQQHDRNEWPVLIERALAAARDVTAYHGADPRHSWLCRGVVHRRAGARLLRPGCSFRAQLDPWLLGCERRTRTAEFRLDRAYPRAVAPASRRARRR